MYLAIYSVVSLCKIDTLLYSVGSLCKIDTLLYPCLMTVLLKVVTVSVPPLLDLPPVEMILSSSTCKRRDTGRCLNIS